ncbi:MAG: ribonuclease HII [Candidatus Cloacimonetes bacterium]|nr:ribonuclease HII [Candidatus Cloacimonadota bacterium]
MISEYQTYKNYGRIIGVDEAGRGPIAGPVVAAAVILSKDCRIVGIDDSKKLSKSKREKLYEEIIQSAKCYAITKVTAKKIDKINILKATFLAMRNVIRKLESLADYYLVDGPFLPTKFGNCKLNIEGKAIVKGDEKFICIAAASILAKVSRDNLMMKYHKKYPQFDFKNNKGYPTKKHISALEKYGIALIHRKSFSPISENEYKKY